MKYFDTHIHFFPDKLAGKALPKLREISKCETYSDGTRAGTVKNLEAWGCAGGMALHLSLIHISLQDAVNGKWGWREHPLAFFR